MKGLIKFISVIGLLFLTSNALAYYETVEFYNDPAEACYVPNHFMGFYVGVNAGYDWYNFFLHRPPQDNLPPLVRPQWKLRYWVPIFTLGYDLYPRRKMPVRLEINFTYNDQHFTQDPLFVAPAGREVFARDTFRFYNTMATVYFDMHNCSRFVPFIGVSGGYNVLVTDHQPQSHVETQREVFDNTSHAITWGGTLGTRFFVTNHLVANLQFRFNDLGELIFKNRNDVTLTDKNDYSSNYFHETTLLFGIAYEF